MVLGLDSVAVTQTSDVAPVLSKKFLNIQATIECKFTLKRIRGMIITFSKMHRGKYSAESDDNNLLSMVYKKL